MKRYINRAKVAGLSTVYRYWATDGEPDPSGTASNAPAGTLSDIVTVAIRNVPDHTIEENLTSQVDGSATSFTTSSNYTSTSLQVFWNGLKQVKDTSFTESGTNTFTTTFTPLSGEYLTVTYRPSEVV